MRAAIREILNASASLTSQERRAIRQMIQDTRDSFTKLETVVQSQPPDIDNSIMLGSPQIPADIGHLRNATLVKRDISHGTAEHS